MAGGLADYIYTTDDGVTYALKQDSSNATVAGASLATNGLDYLPRSIKPRYAMYESDDTLHHRKVYVPTIAAYAALPPTATLKDEGGNLLFVLAYKRGETAKKSRSRNSGVQA